MAWRQGKRLHARRLGVSRDLADVLRSLCRQALADVGERHARPYETTATLEPDEVFLFRAGDLPRRTIPPQQGLEEESQEEAASALFDVVSRPGALDIVTLADARGHPFLFYAISTQTTRGEAIAFVRKHNSSLLLRGGKILTQFGQEATRLDEKILTFERSIDLVIQGEHVAALRDGIVRTLFADVEIAAAAVPALVSRLSDTCGLPLSDATKVALPMACSSRRTLARKLQRLLESPHLGQLNATSIRTYLTALGKEPADFLDGDQIRLADESPRAADSLIEVLGQQWYRGGFDEQLRRAERSSRVE